MDSPFGVLEFLHWNHSWNKHKYPSPEDIERAIILMEQVGINWVRMDFLWSDIEPKKGNFDFARYDSIVHLLVKHKINILGVFQYSTPWASSGGQWNCPPDNNDLFVNYAQKAVMRYKDRVKYWEVWNEPDSDIYWNKQDGLKSYCSLLKDCYAALKKTDPQCKILNGGLANGTPSVENLYANETKDYFDIMNVHYFENPLNKDAIKSVINYPSLVYKMMCRYGDTDKKIWITEVGCPGVRVGEDTNNWWLGKNPNEEQQAAWLKEIYTVLLRDKNVAKIFWAFFRDTKQHWDNGIDYFGIIRWDFSEKPAYKAYRQVFESWKKFE